MVAFVASLVVLALSMAGYHWYAKKRPFDKQLTWGEAMVAGTFVFYIFFMIYGVVPHYWLTWADSDLGWRADRLVFGPGDILKDQNNGGWMPFTITYLVIRDLIAVLIYVAALGANIWYWIHWQTRQARAEAVTKEAEAPSEFGRPLVREGAR